MVKVEQVITKYPSCIACHSVEDKKTFRLIFGNRNDINTIVELCEDCLLELYQKIPVKQGGDV